MFPAADNTFKDLFCGGGGSANGAILGGGELVYAINHWTNAILTHSKNFPFAEHLRIDVKRMTDSHIKRTPDTAILIASPECRNHSVGKGALTLKQQQATLLELLETEDPELKDLGPPGAAEAERSRATMNDVARFAEAKQVKGRPYLCILVENVVDSARWGVGNDGRHFKRWLNRIRAVGYEHEIVYLNSMFCPPVPGPGGIPRSVPQSRDRMYVVFWLRGMRKPDLAVRPPSWCVRCEEAVGGVQTWKKPEKPWGRYGQQYYFGCPRCFGTVIPGAAPAASILDFSLPAPPIGGRERPLKPATRERIRRGLKRLAEEPFAIHRVRPGRDPKPGTLPLVASEAGGHAPVPDYVVLPVSANTHETSPGNRARRAHRSPLFTLNASNDRALVVSNQQHAVPRDAGTSAAQTLRTEGGLALVTKTGHKGANGALARDGGKEPAFGLTTAADWALVLGNRTHGVPRDAGAHPSQTVCTGETVGVVEVQRNGGARPLEDPTHTLRAGGNHHGLLVSNYSPGWTRRAEKFPSGSLATSDGHALVVPYCRTGVAAVAAAEPTATLTTRDRLALVVPSHAEPQPHEQRPVVVSDAILNACGFRMFSIDEKARAMGMDVHPDGSPYVLVGNLRERGKLLGNGVTPAAMAFLIARCVEIVDEYRPDRPTPN